MPALRFYMLGLILRVCMLYSVAGFQCLSPVNKPINWFIVYKLPANSHSQDSQIRNGTGFYYMDSITPHWTFSSVGIQGKGHALYNTLQQIYEIKGNDSVYGLYNDQPPFQEMSRTHGHTKGAFAFRDSGGFWVISSIPGFPAIKTDGYIYPKTGKTNGQTAFCISFDITSLDTIGQIMLFNYPKLYDKQFPRQLTSRFPNMAKVMGTPQKRVMKGTWNKIIKMTSKGHYVFQVFAKAAEFNADLYGGFISPALADSLLTETWQRPQRLSSNCSGKYHVINIEEVGFTKDFFKEGKDHSKWAISSKPAWICIGDINRSKTQFHRGGGSVCFEHQTVWKKFSGLVKGVESCI